MQARTWVRGGWLGAGVAALGVLVGLSPAGWWLEENFGLDWLFALRGPQAPPAAVVVVSIDRESSRRFGLPNEPREWPRHLHARLLQRLSAAGARMVAFDMHFAAARNADDDRAFGRALGAAHNVLLFEYLRRDTVSLGGANSQPAIQVEQLVPPTPALADNAAAMAVFPLPKVPAKVRQNWVFKPEIGDTATIPAAALQLYLRADYPRLKRLIAASGANASALPDGLGPPGAAQSFGNAMRVTRRLFLQHPRLADRVRQTIETERGLSTAVRARLRTLVRLYAGPHSRYVNYYGPPRTLHTIAYHQLLADPPNADLARQLSDKAVFVGFSEHFQPEQRDGFYTVYSQRSGLDVSGVEIAATSFANLLDGSDIVMLTPAQQALVLIGLGLGLGVALRLVPTFAALPVAIALGVAYLLLAVSGFTRHQLWLPLFVPLALQVPAAAIGTVLWRYVDVHRERHNIRRAFGYYLPPAVVDRLAHGLERVGPSAETVYGVCLATDAQQYSTLAESLPPTELHWLLNQYYDALFTPVRHHGGVISDVVGDAMLAIWAAARADADVCGRACHAALEVAAAAEAFNAAHPARQLPTRIGIHCGAITLGHVGAVDHFEYRAVGDIVNTATRIEGLGKHLGCKLLASATVVEKLDGVIARELGRFLVKGKREPVTVYELLGFDARPGAIGLRERCRHFAVALDVLRGGNWDAAAKAFADYDRQFGPDGPARFYLRRLNELRAAEAPTWDGVLVVG